MADQSDVNLMVIPLEVFLESIREMNEPGRSSKGKARSTEGSSTLPLEEFLESIRKKPKEKKWEYIQSFNVQRLVQEDNELDIGSYCLRDQSANLLHFACYAGNIECVNLILDIMYDLGEAVNRKILKDAMHGSQLPLHLAVRKATKSNQQASEQEYVDREFAGDEHLMLSALKGKHSDVVKALYKENVEDNKDNDGKFAFYYACQLGLEDIVNVMMPRATLEAWIQALEMNEIPTAILLKLLKDPKRGLCELSVLKRVTVNLEKKRSDPQIKQALDTLKKMMQRKRDYIVAEHLSNLEKRLPLVNGIIVVAALFATVAYPPATDLGDELGSKWKRLFYIFNDLSYFLAVATVTMGVFSLMPYTNGYLKDTLTMLMMNLLQILMALTIVFGVVAFVISHKHMFHRYDIISAIVLAVGLLPWLCIFWLFLCRLQALLMSMLQRQHRAIGSFPQRPCMN